MKAVPKTLATGSNNPNKQVSVSVWNAGHNVLGQTRADVQALTPSSGQIAYINEFGRQGTFKWDSSNLSAQVAADTAQGLYVAPSSDATGASGAWVRQFANLPIDPEWFGIAEGDAAGANATANNSAWTALVACLAALSVNTANTNYRGLYDVRFGLGTFEFSAPLDLTDGTIVISGRGCGHGSATDLGGPTVLKFYSSTGVRVQHINTSGGSTKDGANHMSASRSAVRDICLEGNFAGTEAEYHGVHARSLTLLENVIARGFAGDGFRVEADVSTVGGDANCSRLLNCEGWACRNGVYVDGNNSNVTQIVGGIYNQNRQWGVWDSSNLGTVQVGVETASNGITSHNDGSSIGVSMVSDGTYRYFAIAGQEVGASTNAPSGTTSDNAYWAYHSTAGTGTGIPLWTSGISVRSGGCFRVDNVLAQTTLLGCYSEQDQAKAQIVQRGLVIGGFASLWVYQSATANQGTPVLTGGDSGSVKTTTAFEAVSGSVTARMGAVQGNTSNHILFGSHSTVSPSGHNLKFHSAASAVRFDYANQDASVAWLVSGPNTADQFGTASPVPHAFVPIKLMVNDNAAPSNAQRANARRLMIDTAAPTSGVHGQGEWTLHRGSDVNQIGWKCTTAGTPGTWSPVYALSSLTVTTSGLVTTATDVILGRSTASGGAVEEIACTAAGRALLDDVDASAQRTTLGLGTAATANQAAAAADLSSTATSGTLPTADGTITIADATTPTNAELLEYCRELESQVETLKANMRTANLLAA